MRRRKLGYCSWNWWSKIMRCQSKRWHADRANDLVSVEGGLLKSRASIYRLIIEYRIKIRQRGCIVFIKFESKQNSTSRYYVFYVRPNMWRRQLLYIMSSKLRYLAIFVYDIIVIENTGKKQKKEAKSNFSLNDCVGVGFTAHRGEMLQRENTDVIYSLTHCGSLATTDVTKYITHIEYVNPSDLTI